MPGIDHGARVQAPVDEQPGAGAKARVVRREECNRRGDLAGLRRPLPRQPDVAARNAPPRTPAPRDDWRALREMSDGTEIPVRWYDPARNRHRAGSKGAWSKIAVRAILQNPRYTGLEVWNKQRRDEVVIDVDDDLGHKPKMR